MHLEYLTTVLLTESEVREFDTNQCCQENSKSHQELTHRTKGAFELTRCGLIDKFGHQHSIDPCSHAPNEPANQLHDRCVDLSEQVPHNQDCVCQEKDLLLSFFHEEARCERCEHRAHNRCHCVKRCVVALPCLGAKTGLKCIDQNVPRLKHISYQAASVTLNMTYQTGAFLSRWLAGRAASIRT